MLDRYESATGQKQIHCVVFDLDGMAAEFLVQLHQAGRQVVTLLRRDQYEGEGSFEQVESGTPGTTIGTGNESVKWPLPALP